MKDSGDNTGKRLKRIFQLHKTLRRSRRGWSAAELADICGEIDPGVNQRTIMSDIKFLRDVLHAPLPERANKHDGYCYTAPYSILEGIDDSYLGSLNEVLALLRQMAGSKEFIGLEDLLLRLEKRVALTTAETDVTIDFDEAELTGKQHLLSLHNAIRNQRFLRVTYQPFVQEVPAVRHIFPLLLKEYNNRWFLIGWELNRETPQTLALDRITSMRITVEDFSYLKSFDRKTYFKTILGVSASGNPPEEIVLRFSKERAQYVVTKKLWPTQQEVWLPDGELEVRFQVQLNRELEAKLLEFGKDVVVILPLTLRNALRAILQQAAANYDNVTHN